MWASHRMTSIFNLQANVPEAPITRNCNTSGHQLRLTTTPLQLVLSQPGTNSRWMWLRLTLSKPLRVSWQCRLLHSQAFLICTILLLRPPDYFTRTRNRTRDNGSRLHYCCPFIVYSRFYNSYFGFSFWPERRPHFIVIGVIYSIVIL